MINVDKVKVVLATMLYSPDVLFRLVMVYAKKTGKNPWQCFGEAFNPNMISLVFRHNDMPIGYCTVSVHPDPDESTMFLHHGLMLLTVDRPDLLMEQIYGVVCSKTGRWYEHIELHSDLPGRLWKRWGFEQDKVKIYKRAVGRMNI